MSSASRWGEKRDAYYRAAKVAGFRARSAYKLLALDARHGLFRPAAPAPPVRAVVDLCAAPGSWSQALAASLPGARLVAVDLQAIAPIPGVAVVQGDITSAATLAAVGAACGGAVDLVVCDGAPDVTGVHDLDAFLQSQLLAAALRAAAALLRPGGSFVAKVFRARGDAAALLLTQMRAAFSYVVVDKPAGSRASSTESFVVCRGFRPPAAGWAPAEAEAPGGESCGVVGGGGGGGGALAAYVACGDLSGWGEGVDGDGAVPLIDRIELAGASEDMSY